MHSTQAVTTVPPACWLKLFLLQEAFPIDSSFLCTSLGLFALLQPWACFLMALHTLFLLVATSGHTGVGDTQDQPIDCGA